MLQPIRTEKYRFVHVPLTETEKKAAKKRGEVPSKAIRGTFRYSGTKEMKGASSRRIFIFQEPATIEDGVIYAGRKMALTSEDFEVGVSLGKIKGRVRKGRRAVRK